MKAILKTLLAIALTFSAVVAFAATHTAAQHTTYSFTITNNTLQPITLKGVKNPVAQGSNQPFLVDDSSFPRTTINSGNSGSYTAKLPQIAGSFDLVYSLSAGNSCQFHFVFTQSGFDPSQSTAVSSEKSAIECTFPPRVGNNINMSVIEIDRKFYCSDANHWSTLPNKSELICQNKYDTVTYYHCAVGDAAVNGIRYGYATSMALLQPGSARRNLCLSGQISSGLTQGACAACFRAYPP